MSTFLSLLKRFAAGVLHLLGIFAIIVVFAGGGIFSYGLSVRLGILNNDFMFIGLLAGFVLGPLAGWLITRKMQEGKLQEFLRALLIIAGIVFSPALLALINVKLDIGASRERHALVIPQPRLNQQNVLAIRDFDNLTSFFWLPVKPETFARYSSGGQFQMTTRPGLLGFEWIEKVHEPRPVRYSPPSSTPPHPKPDPEKTAVER